MKNCHHLIGKSKNEVLEELGDELNYYPDDLWTYNLKVNWLTKTKLHIYFQNDYVKKVKIKKSV